MGLLGVIERNHSVQPMAYVDAKAKWKVSKIVSQDRGMVVLSVVIELSDVGGSVWIDDDLENSQYDVYEMWPKTRMTLQ